MPSVTAPGFRSQLNRLDAFYKELPASGRIALARVTRSSFSSTSNKLRPCMSVLMMTQGSGGWDALTTPAGTSAGRYEPSSLTDKGEFQVAEKAVFDRLIRGNLEGQIPDPIAIDRMLERVNASLPPREGIIDTPFSRIGGPTATATSLVTVLCLASAAGVSPEVAIHYIYNKIAGQNELPAAERMALPVYMSKIVDGGMHGALDRKDRPINPVQEFLFIPFGYSKYTDALEATLEVNARFWDMIRERNFEISIGAEGGIVSPQLTSAIQVLKLMSMAIRGDGQSEKPFPGMFIGLDVAAGELFNYQDAPGQYYLGRDGIKTFGSEFVDHRQLTAFYRALIQGFPIISIEDPYSDADEALEHWAYGFPRMSEDALVITDDMSVTQPDRVKMAVEWGKGGLLTKVNQGGTFTRTAMAMQIAKRHDWVRVLSHRSSEAAEFVFEARTALGAGAEFAKVTVGSMHGGGGGREARVNLLSKANVVWEGLWDGIAQGHPDHADWLRFWGNIPEAERLDGLAYQGALMMVQENPLPWLAKVQSLVRARYEQAGLASIPIHQAPAYAFNAGRLQIEQ